MGPKCATTLVTVPSKAKRRLGVFGGAFDPPHRAHLALAHAAFDQLGLNEILLIPTGQAAHRSTTLSAGEHRLAMLTLALSDAHPAAPPGFMATVDARELQRPGVSYMVDTLRDLHQENPEADLFLLIGADQAQAFCRWHDWIGILDLATVVVAPRETPGSAAEDPISQPPYEFQSHPHARVIALQTALMPISATQLRRQWAQSPTDGKPELATLPPLVGRSVAGYIAQNQLYKAA